MFRVMLRAMSMGVVFSYRLVCVVSFVMPGLVFVCLVSVSSVVPSVDGACTKYRKCHSVTNSHEGMRDRQTTPD